jgi:hypothetical protein
VEERASNALERDDESRDSMTLLDEGWTEEQAIGLLDQLKLLGAVPNWKPKHLQRLYDWCSAHEKNHKTIDGQLEFVAYDLHHSYEAMGMALKRAKSIEEARKAVETYVNLLNASRDDKVLTRRS